MEAINIIKRAFSHIMNNKVEWIKVALAPLVASGLVGGVSMLLIVMNPDLVKTSAAFILMNFAFAFVIMLLYLMAWVQMYRFGVLGEKATGWVNLHFDKNFWRFIGYGLLLAVIMMLIFGAMSVPTYLLHMMHQNEIITYIIGALIALVVIYASLRFAFVLPAAASDCEDPISTSLNISKGNILTTFLVILLMSIISVVIGRILGAVIALPFAGLIAMGAANMMNITVIMSLSVIHAAVDTLISSIILAAGASELYKHMLEKAK